MWIEIHGVMWMIELSDLSFYLLNSGLENAISGST